MQFPADLLSKCCRAFALHRVGVPVAGTMLETLRRWRILTVSALGGTKVTARRQNRAIQPEQYERLIAAFFQTVGYYVERSLIDRGEAEILELDIVATDYQGPEPNRLLVEVKSGGWGFSDIFKIFGWMQYLQFPGGLFVVLKDCDQFEYYRARAAELSVELTQVTSVPGPLENRMLREFSDTDLNHWRLSYTIEFNLIKTLKQRKRQQPELQCYRQIDQYLFLVNSGVFFTRDLPERAEKLYNAFQQFPRLSARCGHEILGDDFDGEYQQVPTELFNETYYVCRLNDIALSTFVEHRARLAILKSAVDCVLQERAHPGSIDTAMLPVSFNSVWQFAGDRFIHRYPIFWQWFLWAFGGFVLTDVEEDEYRALSLKTGVPEADIPRAFAIYDEMFPLQGGWFIQPTQYSHARLMKMLPVPFMGLGAYYRPQLYGDRWEEVRGELGRANHTLTDLQKWQRVAREVFLG